MMHGALPEPAADTEAQGKRGPGPAPPPRPRPARAVRNDALHHALLPGV